MLTKKHFERIAEIIAEAEIWLGKNLPYNHFIEPLLDYFQQENRNFDRERFLIRIDFFKSTLMQIEEERRRQE